MKWPLQVTVVLVAVLLGMSVYPGLIASTIFSLLGIISILPLLGLWFLWVGFMALREVLQRRSFRSAFALHAAAISFFAFGLVVLRIPMRIGFAVSRPAFDSFLRTSPAPDETSRWFGIYRADRWERDSRGGAYFRTGTGADMIDTMSYGFVLQPNPKGSPFGAAGYWVYRIADDWHTFSVSDDYY